MKIKVIIWTCLLAIAWTLEIDEFRKKVYASISKTDAILKQIHSRWQIDQYPAFLKTVAMSRIAWDMLKLKYISKILLTAQGKRQRFVVSFMGSSVTAGHDTAFNITFPTLVGNIMSPAFDLLGVEFESRNSAMGNNPCMPYDACVHAFAGKDADMVHWEQSYNCFAYDPGTRIPFEHFIRQSLSLPNQPIVIFSNSGTPNWKPDDCTNISPLSPLTSDDQELITLIKKDPLKIVTERNHIPDILKPFSAMTDLFKSYQIAGIQMWVHSLYQKYKCYGPYIPDWGCCSASWHPSILGHELRAAHYSYFWLIIYREALEYLSKITNINEAYNAIQKRIQHEHKYRPNNALYPSHYHDDLTCYTTYEPLADPTLSLLTLMLNNTNTNTQSSTSNTNKLPFQRGIMEDFMDKKIVIKARAAGYKDFKYMLYGNKDNLPLSLVINVQHNGYIHLCEPPGSWGKLPSGFHSFSHDHAVDIYLTKINNILELKSFVFTASKGIKYNLKESTTKNTLCAELDGSISIGTYVLTIVPLLEENVMISYLLLP